MRGIEGDSDTSVCSGVAAGDGGAPSQLVHLAAELSRTVCGDMGLLIYPIAARDFDSAFKDEPGGRIVLTYVVHDFAGYEPLHGTAGKAPGRAYLGCIQHRKHLVFAIVDGAHARLGPQLVEERC
jgi:hypothetical protein